MRSLRDRLRVAGASPGSPERHRGQAIRPDSDALAAINTKVHVNAVAPIISLRNIVDLRSRWMRDQAIGRTEPEVAIITKVISAAPNRATEWGTEARRADMM
ncbi:MAG: hypothetical protein CMH84_04380 [Nocardioides sp.]|nr:hypothetical protein [Nocardioides sp.]